MTEVITLWRQPDLQRFAVEGNVFDAMYVANGAVLRELHGRRRPPRNGARLFTDHLRPVKAGIVALDDQPCEVLTHGYVTFGAEDAEYVPLLDEPGDVRIVGTIDDVEVHNYDDSPPEIGLMIRDARILEGPRSAPRLRELHDKVFQPIMSAALIACMERLPGEV